MARAEYACAFFSNCFGFILVLLFPAYRNGIYLHCNLLWGGNGYGMYEYRLSLIHILRPKTIVCYSREAFLYSPANVRITLDRNIRTGLQCMDFLNPLSPYLKATEDITI